MLFKKKKGEVVRRRLTYGFGGTIRCVLTFCALRALPTLPLCGTIRGSTGAVGGTISGVLLLPATPQIHLACGHIYSRMKTYI